MKNPFEIIIEVGFLGLFLNLILLYPFLCITSLAIIVYYNRSIFIKKENGEDLKSLQIKQELSRIKLYQDELRNYLIQNRIPFDDSSFFQSSNWINITLLIRSNVIQKTNFVITVIAFIVAFAALIYTASGAVGKDATLPFIPIPIQFVVLAFGVIFLLIISILVYKNVVNL